MNARININRSDNPFAIFAGTGAIRTFRRPRRTGAVSGPATLPGAAGPIEDRYGPGPGSGPRKEEHLNRTGAATRKIEALRDRGSARGCCSST